MQNLLEPREIQYLSEHFRVATNASPERKGSIQAVDLLDPHACLDYLDDVAGLIESPSRIVTASQFSKRYSYLTVIPCLYALTVFNKGLDLSIWNTYVESINKDQNWLPSLRLSHLHVTQPKADERCQWRNEVIENLFAKHLSKVWHSLSQAVHLPACVLWENTAIYVYWLYEKRMEQEEDPIVKARIKEDFSFLIYEAPPFLFGEKENPLTRYYGRKCTSTSSDQEIRIRKTCCMYYQLSSKNDYCTTCPKVRSCKDQS